MTCYRGLAVPSLHNWRYEDTVFDLVWSIRQCLMCLILDLSYLKKVWNQTSIFLTIKPGNSSRNNELALCAYQMQQRTKNRQTKENSKLIVASFYPLKFIHHRIVMTSQRWAITIFLRHNFANRNCFAFVWIGNDLLRRWGVHEKRVKLNSFIFDLSTQIRLRSERSEGAVTHSGVKEKSLS